MALEKIDILILKALDRTPLHGYGIGQRIEQLSDGVFRITLGSLYPALQRLEERGWIEAEWGTSQTNRKARFYELTKSGRRQLVAETKQWRLLSAAIGRVLGPEEA
jgi:transcriptional regulator